MSIEQLVRSQDESVVIPPPASRPELLDDEEERVDFSDELARLEYYNEVVSDTKQVIAAAEPLFRQNDVSYHARPLEALKRDGLRHIRQVTFLTDQFRHFFQELEGGHNTEQNAYRLNVTYEEIQKHLAEIKRGEDAIHLSQEGGEKALVPALEFTAQFYADQKAELLDRIAYFRQQAVRYNFSLETNAEFKGIVAASNILPDASENKDSDVVVFQNILRRRCEAVARQSQAIDALEVVLNTFVQEVVTPVTPETVPLVTAAEVPPSVVPAELATEHPEVAAIVPAVLPVEKPSPLILEQSARVTEMSPRNEVESPVALLWQTIQTMPFISSDERTTATFFHTTYQRLRDAQASPEQLSIAAENLRSFVEGLNTERDSTVLQSRAELIKQFISNRGVMSTEQLLTLEATHENFKTIFNQYKASGDLENPAVSQAYYNLERMALDAQKAAYRTETLRPLHEKWQAAKHEHEWRTKIYEENLVLHYQSLENRQFGIGKLKYLTQKAFSIKPELPPELIAERTAAFEATARYTQLAREMRTQRTDTSEPNEQTLERYQRLLARTIVVNTFQNQLGAQEKALSNQEQVPIGRVRTFLRANRKLLSMVGAATIGGVTGGVVGGSSAVLRVIGASAASAYAVKKVGESFDQRIATVEQLSDEEFEQSIQGVEQLLARQSLSAAELAGIHDVLSTIYARVDTEKRKKVIALIGTAIVVGAGTGWGIGVGADTLAQNAVPVSAVPPAVFDEAPRFGAATGHEIQPLTIVQHPVEISNIPPTVESELPVLAGPGEAILPIKIVPPPVEVVQSEVSSVLAADPAIATIPGVVLVDPVLEHPSLGRPFSNLAENIPLDPQIEFSRPANEFPESLSTIPEQPTVAESVPPAEVLVTPEATARIAHTLDTGEGVIKVTRSYAEDILAPLSSEQQAAVWREFESRLAASPELQTQAGITSGRSDLVFKGDVLQVTPLLEELRAIIDERIVEPVQSARIMPEIPVSISDASIEPTLPAVDDVNLVSDEEAIVAPASESVAVAASAAETVLREPALSWYVENYEGGDKALALDHAKWVDRVQGTHPSRFGSMLHFFNSNVGHVDAYEALKSMTIRQVSELASLPETARVTRLEALHVLPEDFAKWQQKLRGWNMIPGLRSLSGSVSFDTLSKQAFVLEQLRQAEAA